MNKFEQLLILNNPLKANLVNDWDEHPHTFVKTQ